MNLAKKYPFIWEVVKLVLTVVLVVLPIRFYIAQPFIVSGSSMVPTFKNGDYLIIDEISYRFQSPQRGEVVVFRYPKDPSKFFIKRIVGLPGEEVEIKGGKIYISRDGKQVVGPLYEPYINSQAFVEGQWQLDESEYFVVGDNRRFSSDSRMWGPLSKELLVGRALVRLWPLNALAAMPGLYEFGF